MKNGGQHLDEREAAPHFLNLINSGRGYFIGRIGGTDWDLVSYYYQKVYLHKTSDAATILTDPPFIGRLGTVKSWNGFYDLRGSPDSGVVFCERLIEFYRSFDLATVGNAKLLTTLGFIKEGEWAYSPESNAEYRTSLIGNVVSCDLCNYRYIEDMCGFFCEIYPHLSGKKVLVCCPFTKSFEEQIVRGSLLFSNHPNKAFRYPQFDLVSLPTPITYDGAKHYPHHDWFETCDSLCATIDNLDFDLALLSCGSYALALGSHIKSLGRGAIYMGGALQLYFGVAGRRYLQEYYTKFMNRHWISPREVPDVTVQDESAPSEAWGAYW